MAKSTTSVPKKEQAQIRGTLKVSREVVAKLAELEIARDEMNKQKRIADALRKQILAEVGDDVSATLIHNNKVVGSVDVEVSLSVKKETLLLQHPDIFEALAEETKRVTLEVK
jgi:hypothetical protein